MPIPRSTQQVYSQPLCPTAAIVVHYIVYPVLVVLPEMVHS